MTYVQRPVWKNCSAWACSSLMWVRNVLSFPDIPRLFVWFCLDYLETKAFDSSTKIGGLSPSVFVNTLWCPLIMYSFPRLRADALLMLCPPCSLYSPACQSVHQRTEANPLGNLKNFKVRLALRIWSNMATRMIRLHSFVFFCSFHSFWILF